jgi:hypothetical protein
LCGLSRGALRDESKIVVAGLGGELTLRVGVQIAAIAAEDVHEQEFGGQLR